MSFGAGDNLPEEVSMVRPASTPRLQNLEPEQVARAVVDLVREHMGQLAFVLGPGVEWMERGSGEPLQSTLAWTCMQLTRYAKTGELGEWDAFTGVGDALQ